MRLIDFAKEKELLLDTLEVRKILEREILRMVIHSATREELEELGAITRVLMQSSAGESSRQQRIRSFTIPSTVCPITRLCIS